MFGTSILTNLFDNVKGTGLVPSVYHSVILQEITDGSKRPVAPVVGRFEYVGVNDLKGFSAYCRQTGPAEVGKTERIGGCNSYLTEFNVPHRLVFFNNQEERLHEDLTAKFVKACMMTRKVKIQKVHTIAADVLKLEVPTGNFTFSNLTYYTCIDFLLLLILQAEECEKEINCKDISNPY